MKKKFRLTSIEIGIIGHTLYRIEALKDFGDVKKGDLGGFVEVEENLSQHGTSWVYDNAKVIGKAKVYDNAKVYNNAEIYDCAEIYGNAVVRGSAVVGNLADVYGDAEIYDSAVVYGNASVHGNAKIFNQARVGGETVVFDNAKIGGDADLHGYVQVEGDAAIMSDKDFIVFKNFWSSGRYFTWTRSDNMWTVGCFHGTGEELIEKAYKDSEKSGREYERVVRYAESILKDEERQSNQGASVIPYNWEIIEAVKPISFKSYKYKLKEAFQKFKQTKGELDITFTRRPDSKLAKKYWEIVKGWMNK